MFWVYVCVIPSLHVPFSRSVAGQQPISLSFQPKKKKYIENQNNGTCDEAWPEKKKADEGCFSSFFLYFTCSSLDKKEEKRCVYYVPT